MSNETVVNDNESACSVNLSYSTHRNLHENDDDDSYVQLVDLLPDITNKNGFAIFSGAVAVASKGS